MIIDFHTHIFPDKIAEQAVTSMGKGAGLTPQYNGTKAGLISCMEQSGITRSVVLPVATKPEQTLSVNKWTAQNAGDLLIPFGALHPDNDDWKQQIQTAISLGLKGIKLHPDYQHFWVDDPQMLDKYYYMLNKGLIVSIHAGVDIGLQPPYHCPPARMAKVLEQMKGGTIIAAHLGGFRMWDEVERHLVGRDVYFDTSMGLEHYDTAQFLRIVKNHGSERILFGTDGPWSNQKDELERFNSVDMSPEDKDNILYKNAVKILKL